MRYRVLKALTIGVTVEAESEDEAIGVANELLLDDWDTPDEITVDVTPEAAP